MNGSRCVKGFIPKEWDPMGSNGSTRVTGRSTDAGRSTNGHPELDSAPSQSIAAFDYRSISLHRRGHRDRAPRPLAR